MRLIEGKYYAFPFLWHLEPAFLFLETPSTSDWATARCGASILGAPALHEPGFEKKRGLEIDQNTLVYNTPCEAWEGLHSMVLVPMTNRVLLQLPCPGSLSGEHPAMLTLPGAPCSCSFPHTRACMASLLPYPGRDRSLTGQELHTPHPAMADGKYLFEEISFCVQALSEMGDLRETLETVKSRKSFSWCHLIMKTHFSSSFVATWMGCLFHLKKKSCR